jgi:hypothetical protein
MFNHPYFDRYTPDTIPLDTDVYLRDETFLGEYEDSLLAHWAGKEWKPVGYVSWVSARRITSHSIQLSWFPDISDRFHELSIVLPRDQIVACVGSYQWDEKPSIFVKSEWLKNIHVRFNSVFALVDAIGVRDAINEGILQPAGLNKLRSEIDGLAEHFPQVSFVSFADTVVLKSNWTAGHFPSGIKCTYEPEVFIRLFTEIRRIYKSALDLDVYGVITQGSNEYYEDPLLHISNSKNHICLNSFGAPFADLKAIESTARNAIRNGIHARSELYLDGSYFRSLKLGNNLKERARTDRLYYTYTTSLGKCSAEYVCVTSDEILASLG